jgi:catechol 2,3-dioxygenase-like lactoylglutathione lyase family enzyme
LKRAPACATFASMIDHLGIAVSDFDRSKAFYAKALAPLGYTLIKEFPGVAGFGVPPKPDFWFSVGAVTGQLHLCFHAATRTLVKAFYEAAIAAGGKDNGPPGVRAMYHPSYYGAFVLDPDGHNIEACCHEPYLD